MDRITTDSKNCIIEKCIISLAEGDIDAMDILYETIKKDIYAFALSKVCNKFDADDILQDTFVRIYENAKLYVPQGKPLAWIFKIETNVINRHFQLKKRNETTTDEMIVNIAAEPTKSNSRTLTKDDYLQKALNKLNDFEREVISLHLVSELKFREISKQLNKPLSTVLSKYNRAIKKMQKLLKEENI